VPPALELGTECTGENYPTNGEEKWATISQDFVKITAQSLTAEQIEGIYYLYKSEVVLRCYEQAKSATVTVDGKL
jgi:hypothetical protein